MPLRGDEETINLVTQDGELVLRHFLNWRDEGLPVTTETIYEIGGGKLTFVESPELVGVLGRAWRRVRLFCVLG